MNNQAASKERWNARAKELNFVSMKALLIHHYMFNGHTTGWLSRYLGEGFSRWTVSRMIAEYGMTLERERPRLTPEQHQFWSAILKQEGKK